MGKTGAMAGRPRRAAAGVAVLAVVFCPGVARADPAELSLNGSAAYGYASNLFFLSPVEKRSTRFRSTDDYLFLPQVGAHLRAPVGLQVFELKAVGAYRLYRYNTNIDGLDYNLEAKLAYVLGSLCTGNLLAGQEKRQSDFADVVIGRPQTLTVRDRIAKGDIACAITPEIGAAASAEYRSEANSAAALTVYDLDRTTASVEFNYGLVETGQAFVQGRYRRRSQPLFVTAATPDALSGRILDAGGGGRWAPSSDLEVSGEGYWTQLRETSHRRDSTGFSGALKAIWSYSPKTKFTLVAETGLDVSPNIGAVAFRASTASLLVNWLPTPKLETVVQASYTERGILRDFNPGESLALTRQEHDQTFNISGSVNYSLTDRLVGRLAAGYRDRRGNFEDIGFRARTVSLGLTYRFDGPPIDAPSL